MPKGGQADSSEQEASGPLGSGWQSYSGIYDVPGRLSRSATIALIASPIGLVFISVTRLLIVSDYNPVTASTIVSSGGYVDTLLGTIIPLLPIFTPYLALVLLFFNRVIPAILAFAATAFVSPMALSKSAALLLARNDWHIVTHHNLAVIILMILLAAVFAILLLVEIALGPQAAVKTTATITCLALIPFVVRLYPLPLNNAFYAQQIKQLWLPPETITLKSGQSFTGYVLADSGSWIVVLRSDSRTVIHYPATEVTGREVCQIGSAPPTQPLITLFPTGLHAPTRTQPCGLLAKPPTQLSRGNHPSCGPASRLAAHLIVR